MKADPHGVLTGTHFIDGDHACCEGALRQGRDSPPDTRLLLPQKSWSASRPVFQPLAAHSFRWKMNLLHPLPYKARSGEEPRPSPLPQARDSLS